MNLRYKDSNALWISLAAKYVANLIQSNISIILYINPPSSPMNLFLKYVSCVKREHLLISDRAFDVILASTFDKDIEFQFLAYLLSLSFFFS